MECKTKTVGILTSGGDCPGLNAAIRGVTKAALGQGSKVIGVQDGFRGLVENRTMTLEDKDVSGILTHGGTFLGSSRDKPHKMNMGGTVMDMTEVAVSNARKNHIDCLVCLGGNGTQKNAMRLHEAGLDVITLPKTIDFFRRVEIKLIAVNVSISVVMTVFVLFACPEPWQRGLRDSNLAVSVSLFISLISFLI